MIINPILKYALLIVITVALVAVVNNLYPAKANVTVTIKKQCFKPTIPGSKIWHRSVQTSKVNI